MERALPLWGRSVITLWCAVLLLSGGTLTSASSEPAAARIGEPTAYAGKLTGGEASRPRGLDWFEMQRRYKGAFVLSAPRGTRKVALTFDDVPDPRYTPLILNILKQEKVHATFFVVGGRARKHPATVRRIRREGHAIGNHSYNHPDFSGLSLSQMQNQIRRTEKAIQETAGVAPRLIRPPYGEIKPSQLDWARRNGYTVVNWDVDSSDWRQLSSRRVFANVTKSVRPGSIILLHAGGGEGQNLFGTVRSLPLLIAWLRSHDYEPVTLPELLNIPETR
ncbi:polysaccharide deacetylase family protein [Cohnella lubricantis]|uniref:Polysaccharide deacetylase family protein n=1 Tax=Cohnella lubricantis TaxID=2163172 RepID=A0A841TIL0_9BACL|nr:polysaccharide deacetylase family protein [Cohnella lubricantis]MBB6678321.1 polysaccharide deacetylase family protein [Cohnella lubricantis]MBP2118524.1 peptidoglycan/xylan/chitin deacetylase (PgdA/CDA1 family) [Cohnella lubricantis]